MTATSRSDILTVSAVTARVARVIRADELLADCAVRGELSNFKRSAAGHLYFTLKDSGAELSCAMFRGEAERLRFQPADGMAVVAAGRIDVYEKSGRYQLYVRTLAHDGVGALYEAFERLRARLAAEGLFADERKRPLPRFPRRVAIITSLRGAAVRDMVRVLRSRWPAVRILLVDAVVQGDEAAPSLCHALAMANRLADVEVILFGRGGGSLEDLWAFNEEAVARAIQGSRIPVISAVGHESDITIADLVADARASTPTHAAELAVPDRVETERHLQHLGRRLAGLLERRLEGARAWLRGVSLRRVLTAPESMLEQRAQRIDDLDGRMVRALAVRAERARQRLAGLSQTLAALDPTAVLSRGYAIFTREADGAVVMQPEDMPAGSDGTVRVAGGNVSVTARNPAPSPPGRGLG